MLNIRQGSFEEAIAVKAGIPEMHGSETVKDLLARIGSSPYLLLVAEVDGELAGFKLGYETSGAEGTFYSWQGGVLPAYRSGGIAKKLLLAQESQVAELGYKRITVKSMNRYPHMMKMLLSNGYQISGYQEKTSPVDAKISFQKLLIPA
ncbi:GNAT family N-acetyltransferase [Thalassomonas viridans]|uniref:GNAT family N-acetyltransferase n=1 Tax=Thalassomonas viridans TaxID=137584 RepID=A0AAE9Z0M0_9GAMM|nr:GNAT family N-acetyltransferase [Thalassomonas viridans]WDE03844.1 GNAT family N-acetyltransferase [Thalassomonas viridans]